MSVGRNDPCPCGSGKKYKACCLAKDQARSRMEAAVGAEVFRAAEAEWQAIARDTPVWEAEVAPVAVPLGEDRETAPALVMVAAAGYVVHGDVLPRRPAGAAERARVVASALATAAGELGAWPGAVRVRDEALAAALAEELAPRVVAVEAGAMPQLDEALDASLEHLCESATLARFTVPARWAETEAPAEVLADFHRAAAEFHAAAPWTEMESGEPLALTFPDGSEWGVSVMGAAEEEHGIAMYSDPDDLLDLLDLGEAEDEAEREAEMDDMIAGMRGQWLTVELTSRGKLSRPMVREIAAAGWPVADASAYPVMIGGRLPERRVTAEHVARATLALRAVTLAARELDPEPQTGVKVAWLNPPPLWPLPDEPPPICAEGPGADPARALAGPAEEEVERKEAERLARFTAWLPKHPTREEDLLNARAWKDFLVAQGVSAGAVTEYDLRVFLYDFYPQEAAAPEVAAQLLPQSLDQVFRFLAENEGIRYPFAHRVLRELDDLEAETGAPLDQVLQQARQELYEDLFARSLLHDPDLSEEVQWPVEMDEEIFLLRREIQRRWLLWYDELVRAGTTDFEELEDALIARQREWEAAPHPAIGGRTPAEAVHAYLAMHGKSEEDAG